MKLQSTNWNTRPNPAQTGIRYFATECGASIRNQWPLPQSAVAKLSHVDNSCEGCTKKRSVYVGHKQRTGMWINVCMIHEHIIGYHLIHRSEGRRDAVIPLYRFFEKPPLAVWNDFACGCEESGLNWLPSFFSKTQHFHDMFHGYAHLCSRRFFSRRVPRFSSLNTSLMEQVRRNSSTIQHIVAHVSQNMVVQVNSFLQPLRALVRSPSTRVSKIRQVRLVIQFT